MTEINTQEEFKREVNKFVKLLNTSEYMLPNKALDWWRNVKDIIGIEDIMDDFYADLIFSNIKNKSITPIIKRVPINSYHVFWGCFADYDNIRRLCSIFVHHQKYISYLTKGRNEIMVPFEGEEDCEEDIEKFANSIYNFEYKIEDFCCEFTNNKRGICFLIYSLTQLKNMFGSDIKETLKYVNDKLHKFNSYLLLANPRKEVVEWALENKDALMIDELKLKKGLEFQDDSELKELIKQAMQ